MCKAKCCFLKGLLLFLVLILTGWGEQVQSQDKYPTRAIDIIVTFPAGGGADLTTRIIAAYMNKKWGVPVNVINKPGGNTLPATLEVYAAAPNGYTLLADGQSCSTIAASLKNLPFEVGDRTFVAMTCVSPYAYTVPSTSPFRTLQDLIAALKEAPEKISYVSHGGATGSDYAMKQFFSVIGVDILKAKAILAQGSAQGIILTAGGHVMLGTPSVGSALVSVKAGTIRALVVTSKDRYPELPDVLTTAELGYPKVNAMHWYGISGPPNLPSYIVAVWNKFLGEMIKDPEIISQLRNAGATPFYHDSQATRAFVIKEIEEISKLRK